MKKLLAIAAIILSLFVASCSTPPQESLESTIAPPPQSTESTISDDSKDYQQFDLSVDNFTYFFYFSYHSTGNLSNRADIYEVEGVLSYAYYDHVVVTFDIIYTGRNNTASGEYSILLNAAGYASFQTDDKTLLNTIGCTYYDWDTEEQISIKKITGKIILFY